MNYALRRAIGMNETGFDGAADATYRVQGWDFLMAGGALYNNLDYSFAAGHERGDFRYDDQTPGGGSTELRRQLGILRGFLRRLDLVHMAPAAGVVEAPDGTSVRALAWAGKTYALYLHRGRVVTDAKPRYQVDATSRSTKLNLELPQGRYAVEWLDPKSGKWTRRRELVQAAGPAHSSPPVYTEDFAMLLRAM